MRRWVWLAACILLTPSLMGSACMVQKPKLSSKATYSQNAKTLHEYARKLIKAGNYEQARKEFQQLKTKYPFSDYATLAEVGIADTHFFGTKYLLAIDAYKLFVKLHPTHPKAGYAAYQSALCHDKLRPWDWFLVPPSYEKDATTTKQTIKAYRDYIAEYPTHKKVKFAKKRLKHCLKMMGKHEMYVGKYYKKLGKHRAVVWRMDHLLKSFAGVGLDAEARYMKAEALVNLKRYARAKLANKELVKKHPKSKQAGWGRTLMSKIPGKTPSPSTSSKPKVTKPLLQKTPVIRPAPQPKTQPRKPPIKRQEAL